MLFSDMTFIRKFSLNLCKTLYVPLSKMTFTSDFTETERGDLYPVISKSGDVHEHVSPSGYAVNATGHIERLMGAFFPYGTFKIQISSLDGQAGFVFNANGERAEVLVERDDWETSIVFKNGSVEHKTQIPSEIGESFALSVTLRPKCFDIFVCVNDEYRYIVTEESNGFANSTNYDFFTRAKAHVKVSGNAFIKGAESFVDCGIGQADIRPFRYENGDLIMENGRVFISVSSRMISSGGYQTILSWLPGTTDFKMEGAIFFDNGDGAIHGEVAASFVFNRMDNKWHVWHRNGSAGHVLAYASFEYDVRYGINILDMKPLPLMTGENMDDTVLLGKKGDEDPDFTYDEKRKKWLFSLCRLDSKTRKYRYFFFESDYPDRDYKFVGTGPEGDETGGSIVRLGDKILFVCGNNFHAVSDYRVYEWGKFDTFTNLKCDFPDGGFRGWATIMPVKYGSRVRYFWLTFDRMLMSKTYNWSYGNLYCFEAEGIFKI